MAKKVVAAMSGGVDSSVCAAILKNQGYEVIGLFMHNGVNYDEKNTRSCCSLQDSLDAREVSFQLGIKFYSLDLSKEFSKIMKYFVNEYIEGRTPSPCIKCNTYLKFGALVGFADLIDADYVATGHYARIIKNNERFQIFESIDKEKDQSYFLFELSQKQLSRALMPIGVLTKQQVRNIASKFSLKTASKHESQDLCFIPDGNLKKFLDSQIPDKNVQGYFVDEFANKLGTHSGYIYYTIGQRKGTKIAKGIPLYVKEIRPQTREVVLAEKNKILSKKTIVTKVNWISIAKPEIGSEILSHVKIRYRHPKNPAILKIISDSEVEIEFREYQSAITPGQAACFYNDEILLGGGWIEKKIDEVIK